MIITQVIGGLGNQMFQYAAGRALAEQHGVLLKLDISHFKAYRPRTYQLNCFNIQERFANQLEIARMDWSATTGIFYRVFQVWRKMLPYQPRAAFRENASYDPTIWDMPAQVYLYGYFQSERYFVHQAERIRREFTFRDAPSGLNQTLAQQIGSTQAVSLHIRRGDYISNPITRQMHGVCSLDYYAECIRRIASQLSTPHFYIFSDEPTWANDNLHLKYPASFISHNSPAQAHEDLRLMSLCQHHIIANSSFSWWGAWLNPNPNKLVYAPARWFNDPNKDSQHIIPETWIKV
jgi:hypothetical protein